MNKLYKETIWSFLTKGTVAVFFMAFNIFIARHLGAELFGQWSWFLSVLTIILLFAQFGLDKSARKYVAQYNGTQYLGSVLKSSIILRLIYSLCFTIVYIFVFNPLLTVLGREDLQPMFLVAIPVIFLSGIVEYFKNIFQGLHRLKYNFFISVAEYALRLAFVILLLQCTNNLIAVVYSFNASLFVAALIGLYIFIVCYYRKETLSSVDFKKVIFKYSIPLFFTTAGIMVITEIDTVMLGLLGTNAEVGMYSVAKQAIVKLPHIAFAVSLGTMPVFARITIENKSHLRKMFMKLLKSNAVIFGIISLLIFASGWFFIPLIFGKEYNAAILPMYILTFYMAGHSFSFFLNAFLDYQGLAKKRAVNITLSIALNIFLNYVLIPKYGAVGAALATVASYFPYLLLNWFEVKKVLA